MNLDRRLRDLDALIDKTSEWVDALIALRRGERPPGEAGMTSVLMCRDCGICDVWTDDPERCRACGGSFDEHDVPLGMDPRLMREYRCPRCGHEHLGGDRPEGLTLAGVCPNCGHEPQSLAYKRYFLDDTPPAWLFDPVRVVQPNVICSRCAIVSYWPSGIDGCRVCGYRSRKVDSGRHPDQSPYLCPACGDEHVGCDRLPSVLGCRCGICPTCGYDPLSAAVPGHDAQGNPGMYAYLDAIGTSLC